MVNIKFFGSKMLVKLEFLKLSEFAIFIDSKIKENINVLKIKIYTEIEPTNLQL